MSQEYRIDRRGLLKRATGAAVATIGLPHIVASSALARTGTTAPSKRTGTDAGGATSQGKKPPSGCMNSLFFLDDWLLHARQGLDRKQGRPQMVKEIVIDSHPDPDLTSIRGLGIDYDRRLGRYVMFVDCRDRADNRFFTRLETEDPCS